MRDFALFLAHLPNAAPARCDTVLMGAKLMRHARATPGARAVVNIMQLAFTRLDLALHRRLGRSLGGSIARAPVLVLTTIGRKSGKRRRTPLVYVADAQTYLVVAAYGGSPWNPHWYANLQTNSGAGIEVGGQSITVQAELVTGDDRATLWPHMRTEIASLRTAERRTDREIPLIRLVPTSHEFNKRRPCVVVSSENVLSEQAGRLPSIWIDDLDEGLRAVLGA